MPHQLGSPAGTRLPHVLPDLWRDGFIFISGQRAQTNTLNQTWVMATSEFVLATSGLNENNARRYNKQSKHSKQGKLSKQSKENKTMKNKHHPRSINKAIMVKNNQARCNTPWWTGTAKLGATHMQPNQVNPSNQRDQINLNHCTGSAWKHPTRVAKCRASMETTNHAYQSMHPANCSLRHVLKVHDDMHIVFEILSQ